MRIHAAAQPPGECRVALTPDVVATLVERGHDVTVDAGAGVLAGFADDAFRDAGADVTGHRGDRVDIVATVVDPGDVPVLDNAAAIVGLLDPFSRAERIGELAQRGIAVFAFEGVPRTTRAQAVDALSSQATAAGYQAVLVGAAASDRLFPMLTTAAGTIRPAKVVVLGAGVAGLQAIATARRLGAVVWGFDVRDAVAEQVKSLGARFITIEAADDSSDAGGYATALGVDAQQRIIDGLAPHLADADVVITTASIPGRAAPILIDDPALSAMRPGAVIVDLAAATGGNSTSTVPGETSVSHGVTIIGATDLAGRVAADSSRMFARNTAAFVELVTGEDGALAPDWDDDIVAAACIARDGRIVHPRLAADPDHEETQ